jgi:predicted metal-dependent hydrolase
MDEYRLNYGATTITYTLEYKPRKTLAIEVHPDSSVHVIAPEMSSLASIEAKVIKRGSWITKEQQKFKGYAPALPQRQYVAGESYRYLGKQYRLKIIRGEKAIRLYRGKLELSLPDITDTKQKEMLLNDWFRRQALRVFRERFDLCLKRAKGFGIKHDGQFGLRVMAKRWGSCSKDGRILLNPALIHAPKECIDYVITHELCHTVIHNHSDNFYLLLAQLIPDFDRRKSDLNRLVEC